MGGVYRALQKNVKQTENSFINCCYYIHMHKHVLDGHRRIWYYIIDIQTPISMTSCNEWRKKGHVNKKLGTYVLYISKHIVPVTVQAPSCLIIWLLPFNESKLI